MRLADLIMIANEYQDLGSMVTDQLHTLMAGHLEDHNTHALHLLQRWVTMVERRAGTDADLREDIACLRDNLTTAAAYAA